ncbi:MAG: ATP-binding cassette domain-containing protein [Magnetospirillum sp.]|nr:ATP-binding cassette domain-containing protein [Magnetospirillum sp.]
MLEVEGLTRPGLNPAFLHLAAGECVAVSGPSGAGKTLLLRAIADLDPNEGRVSLDGALRESFSGPAWRCQVTYMAAEPGWWAETVAQHFRHWPGLSGMASRLGLQAEVGAAPVARLSTGERQRLALLRALEGEPKVLLLDEPTAALDAVACHGVEALLSQALGNGVAILLVSHDRAQADRLAGRHLLVEAGCVREEGA